MQKRIIIVHGWMGKPHGDWIPWIKKELEQRDIRVIVPKLSNPLHPQFFVWLSELKEAVGEPDEYTYFIGHSLGCMTILRYLEQLGLSQTIGGCVFVAAFADKPFGFFRSFFKDPLQWEKVHQQCKKFTVIHSNNDKVVPLAQRDIFKKYLNAKSLIEHNKGHMTGWDKMFEFPSLLEEILSMVEGD